MKKVILYFPHQLMDSPKCHPASSWMKGDLIRQDELYGAKRRKEGASVYVECADHEMSSTVQWYLR